MQGWDEGHELSLQPVIVLLKVSLMFIVVDWCGTFVEAGEDPAQLSLFPLTGHLSLRRHVSWARFV